MEDPKTIEKIFNEHKDRMLRLALYLVRNKPDAEDVLQNATLKIIEHLDSFRGESKLSTWIYRITYNEAMMFLRKQSTMVTVETWQDTKERQEIAYFYIHWPQIPDDQLLDKEFKLRVDAAINQMPIQYRMPLLVHNVEGFSLEDTAEILGLKLNSLKTRIHRAFLFMRQAISEYSRDKKEQVQCEDDTACPTTVGFIYDYANQTLDQKRTHNFQNHIQDCPSCTEFLDNYLQAIHITKAVKCQDIPNALRVKIAEFIARNEKDDNKDVAEQEEQEE